ncbi:hypothetical protein GQX73_g3891 [Xylaria multiplex]|uniref:Bystin n=1 Tax=Xylaria multiplex TaxID=323545 RepID=A0A7C8MZR8_9PEZI|nr:hypothetical protein GQX73_g3891 [Xylaria multiplex]
MPKATTPTSGRRRGLEEEYLVGSGLLKNRPSKSKSKSKSQQDDEEERENNFIDARASRKILDIGRQLAEEDAPARRTEPTTTAAFGFDSRFEGEGQDDAYDEEELWADDDDDIIEHVDVDPDDLQTFQQFLPSGFDDPLLTEGPWATTTQEPAEERGTSTNLADLIAAREASAGTEGGGATNVFIKTLLDKRYALPWQVVDSLVFHFLRFRNTDPASVTEADVMKTGERASTQAKLPVIWHQTLLSFAVRYKNEITEDQVSHPKPPISILYLCIGNVSLIGDFLPL